EQWVDYAQKHLKSKVFVDIQIYKWISTSTINDGPYRLHDVFERSKLLNITYLAMFDSMIILLEPEKLLSNLIFKDKPLVTPLLRSTKGMYTSTFWLYDHTNDFDRYKKIYYREKLGCFQIRGGIKDFYFFNFQYSNVNETFLYNKQNHQQKQIAGIDEIARNYSIPMYVCNRDFYGYIPAQFPEANFDDTIVNDLYIYMLIEHQLNGPNQTYLKPIEKSHHISLVKL
ncbi:unnamed protein product, partial [Didymodactylos carnosus]